MVRFFALFITMALTVCQATAGEAKVEKWATGLSSPKGIALDDKGTIFVVEAGTGNLVSFSSDASSRKIVAKGLHRANFAYSYKNRILVSESVSNTVVTVTNDGKFSRIATHIRNPMGICLFPVYGERFVIVSNKHSAIYAIEPELPAYRSVIFASRPGGMSEGFMDIVVDSQNNFYISDAGGSCLWLGDGRRPMRKVADQLNQPSGVVIGPDNKAFVTEAGSGNLSRLEAGGTVKRVADGLGSPFDAVHLGSGVFLVTDSKNGCIWKVTLAE